MIKGITSGAGIQVTNSPTSWPSFYNNSTASNNTLVGQVRYNGASQNMEVYDGMIWQTMNSSYPSIELAPHVQAVVEWAKSKMAEESKLRELAARHPTVADAVEALKRAEEQVRIVAALVETE